MFSVAFAQVLFGGHSFIKRDIHRYYYPVWHYAHEELSRGSFPLWNPFTDFGVPFFANVQSCVLYPGSFIYFLGDYTTAFNWQILLHLAAAAFFTYVWLRSCGSSFAAAFIGGAAYGASGYMLSSVNLTIALQACAWFPLVLWAYRRSMRRGGILPRALAAAVLLVQYLAGDPAVCFATFLVLGFYAVLRSVEGSVAAGRLSIRPLAHLAGVAAIFAGLGAFQLFLFAELLSQSTRAGMGYGESTMWSMPLRDLAGVAVPFFGDLSIGLFSYWARQSWLENYYMGASVLVLAALGSRLIRERTVSLHVGLALLGLALALGKNAPLYPILREVMPFFSFIRYPVRFFFLFSFAAACLAAFGVDSILSRSGNPRRLPLRTFVLFLLSCAAIVTSLYAGPISDALASALQAAGWCRTRPPEAVSAFIEPAVTNLGRSCLFAALAFAAYLSSVHVRPRAAVLGVFLAVVVGADLFAANAFEPTVERARLYPEPPALKVLKKDEGVFRVLSSPSSVQRQWFPTRDDFEEIHAELSLLMAPNSLLLHRISNAIGYDSIFLKRVAAIQREIINLKIFPEGSPRTTNRPDRFQLLDWIGVKYVASGHNDIGRKFKAVSTSEYGTLFRNESVLPSAYLVAEARRSSGPKALLWRLSHHYDGRDWIYLEEEPETVPSAPSGPNSVSITSYAPGKVVMTAEVSDRPWLFFPDSYYPGWQVRIDGRKVKLYRANYAFRAVRVPPGLHRVEWSYEPPLFYAGVAVSFLTALGVGLAALHGSKPLVSRRLRIAL